MTFVLSPQAVNSLQEIRAYTTQHYGARQAFVYLEMLRTQMRKAAADPERAGKKCDDVKPGYFAIRAKKHHM